MGWNQRYVVLCHALHTMNIIRIAFIFDFVSERKRACIHASGKRRIFFFVPYSPVALHNSGYIKFNYIIQ